MLCWWNGFQGWGKGERIRMEVKSWKGKVSVERGEGGQEKCMSGGRDCCLGCFWWCPTRIEEDWGDVDRGEDMEQGEG